jgi:plasmid stabilization system protein ParE
MSDNRGFALHPLAAQDISDIWEYIAEDNALAASRVRGDYYTGFEHWWRFHSRAIAAQTSLRARCGSCWCVNM